MTTTDTASLGVSSPGVAHARALLEQAPDGIFVADIEGRYTYVNEAGCRLLGCERADIVGRTILDFIPAEDAARLAESKQHMLSSASQIGDWQLRRKDGTWVPVEVNAKILPDGQWQGFVRDLSVHRRNEQRLELALDSSRAALWDTDLRTGEVVLSPAWGEMLGGRREETRTTLRKLVQLIHPDDVPGAIGASVQTLKGLRSHYFWEHRVRTSDGGWMWILSRGKVTERDPATGRALRMVGTIIDISERKAHEAERDALARRIEEDHRLLQAIFDILPVGVWIADATGRIVRNNPAGERVWKGARYVPVGQFGEYKGWWVDSGKPIAPEEWALARALTNGETSTGELVRIQCFDGSFKTIINSAAPLKDEDGAIAGAIVVNEDITSLQRTQEQLRAAVRDREEILAIVTHDLRNPLSGLMMGAAATERTARGLPGGEAVRALAASLMDMSRHMSGMVDDLLAVAVASSGGPSMLRLAPVAGSSLLARAAEAARPLLARERLELEVRVPGELPTVHVDGDRIVRVFANLLDNALKFTSAPGRITLAAETSIGGVRFSVANSGPPLPDAQLNAMFQPFWQAGQDRRGAGLGLAICRSIVEAHGGTIWAEPAKGQRVRVCFVLPRQPAAHAGA